MRILLRRNNRGILLMLPTRLVFGRYGIRMACRLAGKYAPEAMRQVPVEALEAICLEIGRIRRKYGRWNLVEVITADGEYISITL